MILRCAEGECRIEMIGVPHRADLSDVQDGAFITEKRPDHRTLDLSSSNMMGMSQIRPIPQGIWDLPEFLSLIADRLALYPCPQLEHPFALVVLRGQSRSRPRYMGEARQMRGKVAEAWNMRSEDTQILFAKWNEIEEQRGEFQMAFLHHGWDSLPTMLDYAGCDLERKPRMSHRKIYTHAD